MGKKEEIEHNSQFEGDKPTIEKSPFFYSWLEDESEIRSRLWLDNAPRLVPLISHRFLVSDYNLTDRPVLSVYGSDIIVYGWDLRIYLFNELRRHLNLLQIVYDEEDQCNYVEFRSELKNILASSFAGASQKDIPYWKEMVLI